MGNITQQPDQHPVDTFLERHSDKITEPYLARIREAAVKAISGHDINLNNCPASLRGELLDLIITEADARRKRVEAEYINRSRNKEFKTGKNATWI